MYGNKRQGRNLKINYSGERIIVSDTTLEAEFLQLLLTDFAGCSDIYQLIVSKKTLDDIKKESDYVEICFQEPQEVNVNGKEKIVFNSLFIPLSGRYATDDQITFFPSYSKQHYNPYLNKKGLKELISKLENFK